MRIRRFVHFGIFIVWVGAMVILHQRVSSRSFLEGGARVDVADGSVILREDHMVLYLNSAPSGVSNFLLEEIPGETATGGKLYAFEGDIALRIAAMGITVGTRLSSAGVVNPDLTLRRVKMQFSTMDTKVESSAVRRGNTIEVTYDSSGSQQKQTIPVSGPVYPPDVMHLVVARQGLETGRVYELQGFEPFTSVVGTYRIRVLGPRTYQTVAGPVNGIALESEYQKITSTHVIDRDGATYLMEAEMAGIPFMAVRDQEAQSGMLPAQAEPSDTSDLLVESMLVSNVIIDRPKDVKRMVVTLQPIAPEDLVLDNNYQRMLSRNAEDQSMRVEVSSPHLVRGTPRGGSVSNTNPAGQPYLREEPMVQVGDPRILAKAKEVTRGAHGTWDAAERIARYLHDNMNQMPRVTIPSAVEVLNSMAGDCNEHSTLFCAMARSVGIPTKICAGLVYLDGKFGYHAWNEVLVGNRWMPVDSTLGRFRMGATNIKLAEGGLDKQAAIVHLVGKLRVQVDDVEYAN